MLGRKTGQMSFGDIETRGRVPEGHFLRKIDQQIDWRPFEQMLESLYHPRLGWPSRRLTPPGGVVYSGRRPLEKEVRW